MLQKFLVCTRLCWHAWVMLAEIGSATFCQLDDPAVFDTFAVHFFYHEWSLLFVFEFKNFPLALSLALNVFHAFDCSSYHFVLCVFHYLVLDLLICETSLKQWSWTRYINQDVFIESKFAENERFWVIEWCLLGLEINCGELGIFLGFWWLCGIRDFGENNDTLLFVFPVDESHFFKFATVMADVDDIGFEFFG